MLQRAHVLFNVLYNHILWQSRDIIGLNDILEFFLYVLSEHISIHFLDILSLT